MGRVLERRGKTLAVGESCTGGLLSGSITSVNGSSAYFLGGVVAYANAVKTRELGVDAATLRRHGAVSARVACLMAQGARKRFRADIGVAVTGIAGPAGGTATKPVGLVYIGTADAAGCVAREFQFKGDRETVRKRSCEAALRMIKELLSGEKPVCKHH